MNIFYCYSRKLKDFLIKNGITYLYKEVRKDNGKVYWTFEKTEFLNSLLEKWKNNNLR